MAEDENAAAEDAAADEDAADAASAERSLLAEEEDAAAAAAPAAAASNAEEGDGEDPRSPGAGTERGSTDVPMTLSPSSNAGSSANANASANAVEEATRAAEELYEYEREQDEDAAAVDDDIDAAVAAAGAEIDAFLADAMPFEGDDDDDDADVDDDDVSPTQIAAKEAETNAATEQHARAKAALASLTERLRRVDDELGELEGDRDRVVAAAEDLGGLGVEPAEGAVDMGQALDATISSLPKRRNLTREASEFETEIEKRRAESERLRRDVAVAREELTEAENNLAQLAARSDRVAAAREKRDAADAAEAAESDARDAAAVRAYAAKKRDAETRRAVAAEMVREKERAVVAAARASRRDAYRRLGEKLSVARAQLEVFERMRNARYEEKVNGLIELKDATDAALKGVARYVGAKRAAHEARRAAQRREAKELLIAGENPHLVFRAREENHRLAAQRKRNAKTIETNRAEISRRLERDETRYRENLEIKRLAREKDEKFSRAYGEASKAAKIRAYMQNAVGVSDLLDPTGTETIYPSDVSRAKPRGFGLATGAGADAATRARVAARHPDANLDASGLMTTEERFMLRTFLDGDGTGEVFDRTLGETGADWRAFATTRDFSPDDGDGSDPEPGTEDPDVAEWRRIRKGVVALENARLYANARENFADPARLYKPQKVCGREFRGDSFESNPRVIVFRDFVPGETYRQRVSMTNVSYGKCAFKIKHLDMDPAFAGFFEFEYDYPGRIPPGMSRDVVIAFAPTAATSFVTSIPVATSTGPIHLPVECHPRVADVFTTTPVIDFDEVVVGECGSLIGELENAGGVPTPFKVLPVRGRRSRYAAESDAPPPPSEQFAVRVKGVGKAAKEGGKALREGVVPGFGKALLSVRFYPKAIGDVEEEIVVRLGEPLNRDVVMSVRGRGGAVPVHLNGRDVCDFKSIAIGCSYRDAIVVYNDGGAAAKCVVKIPKELRGIAEVVPNDFVFVQGRSHAVFSLKITPTDDTLERCAKWRSDAGAGQLAIPMRVAVPTQSAPVRFTLKCAPTGSALLFDPPRLDFGRVPAGETSIVRLKVTNSGALSQRFGVVGLPSDVTVEPGSFGEILGGETVVLDVRYSPIAAVYPPKEFEFTLKSLLGGKTYTAPCVGSSYDPPLTFPVGNVITLPPTAERERVVGSVVVRNRGKHEETFEVFTPEDASDALHVTPRVATLRPGEGCRVEVEYCPPAGSLAGRRRLREEEEEEEGGGAAAADGDAGEDGAAAADGEAGEDGAAAADGEAGEDGAAASSPARPKTPPRLREPRHDVWRLPVYVRDNSERAAMDAADAGALPSAWKSSPSHGHGELVQHVEVRAVTRASAVTVENLPEVDDAAELTYVMDFEHTAVGDRKLMPLILRNHSESDVYVGSDTPWGAFTVVSAFRSVAPGSSETVSMEFAPTEELAYEETFTVKTSMRAIRVLLKGVGTSPFLSVTPEDVVDVGDCAPGETSRVAMTVTNPTAFRQPFVVGVRDVSHPGATSRVPFVVSPGGGHLDPGASAEIDVSFAPDRAGRYGATSQFTGVIFVAVPSLAAETTLTLRARCWDRGAYLVGVDDAAELEMVDARGTGAIGVAATRAFLPRDGDALRAPPPPPRDDERLTLTLAGLCRPGESVGGVVHVGALRGDAGGEYEIEAFGDDAITRGWSVDAPSGAVAAGERVAVAFTFAPPEKVRPGDLAWFGLKEWVTTTTRVTLKGGDPAHEEDGKAITLTLRCELTPWKPGEREAVEAERRAAEEAAAAAEAEAAAAAAEGVEGGSPQKSEAAAE